jgi:microcompartment protein CcmL/EutN
MGEAGVEAIGLLELDSIAAGVEVADAMVKAAPVAVVDAFMVTPGKFVVLVHGDPSSVSSSLAAGRQVAAGTLIDALEIPFLDAQVLPALRREVRIETVAAVGLVETTSIAAGVRSADDAAKAAAVTLVHLHLGRGIGGKSVLLVEGALSDVQAAVDAAAGPARACGRLAATRVIAQPHADVAARLRAGLQRAGDPEV